MFVNTPPGQTAPDPGAGRLRRLAFVETPRRGVSTPLRSRHEHYPPERLPALDIGVRRRRL
jgi:hypothetical protein